MPTGKQAFCEACLLDLSSEAIYLRDAQDRITYWNGGAEALYGWTRKEALGRTPADLLKTERSFSLSEVSCAFERDGCWKGELAHVCRDGKRVTLQSRWWRVDAGADSTTNSIIQIDTDITARKEAEAALADEGERKVLDDRPAQMEAEIVKRTHELVRANEVKDQFIATLSHELRTPLTPVLAIVSYLVKQSSGLPRELRSEMEMIQRNIELEARLIDDLLDITRISRGKLELAREIIDAHSAVRDAFEICAQDVCRKNLDVDLDLQAAQHFVLADPVRLHQVCWNLINNAVKFTPADGTIFVRSQNGANGEFVLEVQDNGIGFEPEALTHMFAAFDQGNHSTTRKFGGLGLGLTIAKSLVEAHEGKIEATSKGKNLGAMFKVTLQSVAAKNDGSAITSESSPQKGALRILVVDDHDDTRRVIANLLTMKGHEVFSAMNVSSALEVLNRQSVDVLLSDIGLPDGTGYALMESAKAIQPLTGIAFSGFGMAEDVKRAFDSGFAHHMIKPINFDRLESILRQIIAKAVFKNTSTPISSPLPKSLIHS